MTEDSRNEARSNSDVFVSYASADAAIANSVVDALERAGVRCWIALRDVVPGSLYADGIVRAINGTRYFVLVLSEHALASKHVGKEIERASSKGHPVFAIRTDAAPLTPAFEYFLSESQWIDVGTAGVDVAVAKLVSAIRGQALEPAIPTKASKQQVPGVSPLRSRRLTVLLAGLAVLALGILLATFWPTNKSASQSAVVTPSVAPPSETKVQSVSEKSIAVLPFTDMSEKKDQEYFGDGMAEEILDLLVKVPGLRVVARTSSFQFKGANQDLRTVGSTLGVAHVVEGSVRRAGDRVRVTAQLIRAADGVHEWSDSYERTLEDVLKVQGEIATGIARALQITVQEGSLSVSGTRNSEGYDLFLRGLHAFERYDEAGFEEAANYFQQSLDLEPSFTRASEYLAWTHFQQAAWGYVQPEIGFERARKEAEQIVKLNPESAPGHALLARIYTEYDWNWDAARREAAAAVAISPRWFVGHYALAVVHRVQGEFDDAIRSYNVALSLDPLNPETHADLGHAFHRAGRFVEALAEHRHSLEISPSIGYGHADVAFDLLALGERDAALNEAQPITDDTGKLQSLAAIYYAMGRKSDSDAVLEQLTQTGKSPWEIASIHAYRGEADEALDWLERAYVQKDFQLLGTKGDPLFRPIEQDPRYKAFLRKMNLSE